MPVLSLFSFHAPVLDNALTCWVQITDLCRSTWTNHLMGLSGILDSAPVQSCQDDHASKLIQTCRQYLIYHLIMAKATFCSKDVMPRSELTLSRNLEQWEVWNGDQKRQVISELLCEDQQLSSVSRNPGLAFRTSDNMRLIESSQGFSNALLLLINDICDLTNQHTTCRQIDRAGITSRVSYIQQCLRELNQISPHPSDIYLRAGQLLETHEMLHKRVESITATAEANRLAALLFLDEMCDLHFPDIIPTCRSNRSNIIQRILSLAEEVCEKYTVTAALPIWPTFLAGCSSGEENRVRVLTILERFQRGRSFGVRNFHSKKCRLLYVLT